MWITNKCSMLGMTVDTKQQRMFVAEFGNNRLAVVDLPAGKVLPTIAGLREPQGVAYVSFADSGFVPAMASLRMLRGEDLTPIRRIDPGDNAGNMRVDAAATGCSWVTAVRAGGNRSGKRTKTADIRLKGHPEGFNIDEAGTQVFINVPGRARDRGPRSCGGVAPDRSRRNGGDRISRWQSTARRTGFRRLSQPATLMARFPAGTAVSRPTSTRGAGQWPHRGRDPCRRDLRLRRDERAGSPVRPCCYGTARNSLALGLAFPITD
jgi:hypothetical protein